MSSLVISISVNRVHRQLIGDNCQTGEKYDYTCACLQGYTGDNCRTGEQLSYTSICMQGYTRDNCQTGLLAP